MVAALAGAPVVWAQGDAMKKTAAPAATHFTKFETLDVKGILPNPPAPDSLAGAAEIDALLQAQAWRTPEQAAWAQAVNKNDLFELFGAGNLLGPNFTKEKFPLMVALQKDLLDDTRAVVDAAKDFHKRARPFLADARIQPIIEKPMGYSYPSGHAFGAHMRAAVLAEIFPGKRAELMERAHRIAWGRALAGVHFPSDLEGARRLAEACVAELKKSPEFRAALANCRAEAAMAMAKAN